MEESFKTAIDEQSICACVIWIPGRNTTEVWQQGLKTFKEEMETQTIAQL